MRGRTLIDAVENLEGDITIEQDEANNMTLSAQGTAVTLPGLGADSFLFEMPDSDNASATVTLDQAFIEALLIAAQNSNEESLHVNLVGVTMVVDGDQNSVALYSTDNISCTRIVIASECSGDTTAILPKSSCLLIAKTLKDLAVSADYEATLFVLEDSVLVTYTPSDQDENCPHVWLCAKTLQAEPADYEEVLDKNLEDTQYGDVPEGLDKALGQCSIMFKDDYDRSVQVTPVEGGMELFAKGVYGEAQIELEFEGTEIPEQSVMISPDYVRRMLPHAEAMTFCSQALALHKETDHWSLTYMVSYKRA